MKAQDTIQYLRRKLRFVTCDRLVILTLFATTLLKLRNLGHKSIWPWDEIKHAIVARNLMKHPLKPTLFDQPYLLYDYRFWGENHVWLHKPPYAMWQIALSYYIFGVNTFALRLPSVIMSGLAVLVTYLIGSELYDKRVGLAAAFLQAVNPLMMNLVHGYVFSDHINTALIFWVELSCYLLIRGIKTGKTKYYIWSGVAQGLGYLSKSYLCLISFGIAVAIFVLAKIGVLKSCKENIKAKSVFAQALFSMLVAAPWVIFCLIKYPKEFIYENFMVLAHLYRGVEVWERAWDFHLFQYIPSHYPYVYLIVFVSFFFLLAFAIRDRILSDLYIILWIVGVVFTLSISTSKVPAGTDIAVPAILLCFSVVCFRIIRGDYRIAVIGYFSLVFSLFFLSQWPFHLFDGIKDAISSFIRHSTIMKETAPALYSNSWIIYQLLCYLAAFVVFFAIYMSLRLPRRRLWREKYISLLKIVTVFMLVALVFPMISETAKITSREEKPDDFEDVGEYIKERLPGNSALLLDSPKGYDAYYLMFHADRSTYKLRRHDAFWIPKDESFLGWADYVLEADYMLDDPAKMIAFNYRVTDHKNFYRFDQEQNLLLLNLWINGRREANVASGASHVFVPNIWYRVQTSVKGNHHILKVKVISDPTPFSEIKPYIELDDTHRKNNGTIGVFGEGYADNIVVYEAGQGYTKSGILFKEDFEGEGLDELPSRWKSVGRGTKEVGARVVQDPLGKNNKVLHVDTPLNIEDPARAIGGRGGIPYLVSAEDYSYPLVYESPVKPHYRIYKVMQNKDARRTTPVR